MVTWVLPPIRTNVIFPTGVSTVTLGDADIVLGSLSEAALSSNLPGSFFAAASGLFFDAFGIVIFLCISGCEACLPAESLEQSYDRSRDSMRLASRSEATPSATRRAKPA